MSKILLDPKFPPDYPAMVIELEQIDLDRGYAKAPHDLFDSTPVQLVLTVSAQLLDTITIPMPVRTEEKAIEAS